jgi:hypothetical protein
MRPAVLATRSTRIVAVSMSAVSPADMRVDESGGRVVKYLVHCDPVDSDQ